MNWIKGAVIGSVAAATAVVVYKEMDKKQINKIMKKGKYMAKKIGVI